MAERMMADFTYLLTIINLSIFFFYKVIEMLSPFLILAIIANQNAAIILLVLVFRSPL